MVGDKKQDNNKINWLILEQEAALVFKFRSGVLHLFGPEGCTRKKLKMAYKSTFISFLFQNKHTFIKETFHFLPYNNFFLIFLLLPLKSVFLGFKIF